MAGAILAAVIELHELDQSAQGFARRVYAQALQGAYRRRHVRSRRDGTVAPASVNEEAAKTSMG